MREGNSKEVRHRLTVERGDICSEYHIVPPKSLKGVIKAVHDDMHSGVLNIKIRLKI